MRANYTPGPWTAECVHARAPNTGWPSFRIAGPDGKSICAAASNSTRDRFEIESNARAIAALPALIAHIAGALSIACNAAGEPGGTEQERLERIATTLNAALGCIDDGRGQGR